jgi:hypothetical protein
VYDLKGNSVREPLDVELAKQKALLAKELDDNPIDWLLCARIQEVIENIQQKIFEAAETAATTVRERQEVARRNLEKVRGSFDLKKDDSEMIFQQVKNINSDNYLDNVLFAVLILAKHRH